MKTKTIEQNGFKKTEIGLIPEDWKAVELGDEEYFEILSSGIDKFDNSKKYLSTSSIERDKIIAVECDITYKNRPSRANMQPKIDTVWFAKMKNTIKVYTFTGKNKADINEYILSTGFAGTLCNKNKAEPKYLEKVFLSTWFNRIKDTLAHGSTQKAVNNQDIKKILIPVPPLPEQQKISSVLSKIQQAIEQQDKIIQITKELKKSLMNNLFTEGLHGEEQKETEIGLMPKSWKAVKLGDDDILEIVQYGISKRGENKGKYAILRMNNLIGSYVNSEKLQFVDIEEDLFNKFKLKEGDILFNRTNSIDLVGKTGIFNLKGEYIFASYLIRLRTNRKKLNPYFLNIYLNLLASQERLKTLATRGVSQSNISGSRLKTFLIPLPSDLTEQEEIVEIIAGIDKKLSQAESRKQTLQSLFKTMLNQLMTGRIRVKNLDIGVN